MLISQLQSLKNYAKELEAIKKKLRALNAADVCTKKGLKKKEKLPFYQKLRDEAQTLYDSNLADVEQWLDETDIEPSLKRAIVDYYIKDQTLVQVQETYNSENFIREVKNLCYKV